MFALIAEIAPDFVELRASETSLMPDGFETKIDVQAMADLLAFLRATRW